MNTIFTSADRFGDSMTVSKNTDDEFEFLIDNEGALHTEIHNLSQIDAARLVAVLFNEMDGAAQALTRTWMGDR
ncbi:hypothetical protein SEA_DATBOI_49 [Gordonia phage DatBoi]|nr:hypothetical protein SEA_DATBOI_49 [Gordonia phage DatBoi]